MPVKRSHTALRNMTVAEAELVIALDQIAQLVDIMRRCDSDYVECHSEREATTDEEWDEALEEAEDYLEERG
jgi:hypothetical protein